MPVRALSVFLYLIALIVPSLAWADEKAPLRHYTSDTRCRHPLPEKAAFTVQERWAWAERLCMGETANMSEYGGGDEGGCDAKEADAWPQTRRLSQKFLRTILFHEPFKSAPPQPRFRILCALFDEEIDFSYLDLANEVWLNKSRFKESIDLSSLKARYVVSLEGSVFENQITIQDARFGDELSARGSTFEGPFEADRLEVAKDVFLDQDATFKNSVRLVNARIGGSLTARRSTFEAPFSAENLVVDGHLFLGQGATFREGILLPGAKISGQLNARGSTFEGPFDADGFEVEEDLFLDQGTAFKKEVRLTSAKIGGELNAGGSTFEGPFNAGNLKVKQGLILDQSALLKSSFLGQSASFRDVILLQDARIGGQLSARGSTFEGLFDADGLEVEEDLFLDQGATFREGIRLLDAKVGGQLNVGGSAFEGPFEADGLKVKQGLYLDQGAIFKKGVRLTSAKVGGELSARGSTFEGPFQADRLEVGEDLLLDRGAVFRERIYFSRGTLKGYVHIGGSEFHNEANFIGTTIDKDLNLASTVAGEIPPRWFAGASLILRNVSARALQESRLAWCRKDRENDCLKNNKNGFVPVDLQGFKFRRLGGVGLGSTPDTMDTRESDWLVAWLGAQPDHGRLYLPQPYLHLANVLREIGNPAKADDVLYALRDHERKAASTHFHAKVWLTLQWALTGYGYANWRVLVPFALLVACGALICRNAHELASFSVPRKLWYSLDRALPIVSLGASTDENAPSNWVAYYFYAHQFVGLVLAMFLFAGVFGFAK
jgi:hypothetical protein